VEEWVNKKGVKDGERGVRKPRVRLDSESKRSKRSSE